MVEEKDSLEVEDAPGVADLSGTVREPVLELLEEEDLEGEEVEEVVKELDCEADSETVDSTELVGVSEDEELAENREVELTVAERVESLKEEVEEDETLAELDRD